MAATRILKAAAEGQRSPREWLLKNLNQYKSQFKLAGELGVSPAEISRAMAEYKIIEVKRYKFKGSNHYVVREWMREEDLMRRHDWQELR